MTLADWLARHPYLQPVAELHASVDAALATISVPEARLPDFPACADDFLAGVPLLHSAHAEIDLEPVERGVQSLIEALSRTAPAERLHDAGWLRFLRATILRMYLRPVVRAFNAWRDEDRWMRSACPTCGTPPAMAQLVGKDPGRMRFLWCGSCRTHWRYARTGCPFCERTDDRPLAALAIENEGGLRIDYCEACRGYLKTYDGTGDEAVLLADWTSVHLDLLARDRGLKRLGASLYEI